MRKKCKYFGAFQNYYRRVGNTLKVQKFVTGNFLSFNECFWQDFVFSKQNIQPLKFV